MVQRACYRYVCRYEVQILVGLAGLVGLVRGIGLDWIGLDWIDRLVEEQKIPIHSLTYSWSLSAAVGI